MFLICKSVPGIVCFIFNLDIHMRDERDNSIVFSIRIAKFSTLNRHSEGIRAENEERFIFNKI